MAAPRVQLAEELMRRLGATLRSSQLYSRTHPIIARNLESLSTALQLLHALNPSIVIGFVEEEIIVDELPLPRNETYLGLVRRFKQIGVERITIDRGVTRDELATFLDAVSTVEAPAEGELAELPTLTHIRVGRVAVE
jgi:hypothetical protein